MIRFYLMPLLNVQLEGRNHRAPKYVRSRINPDGIPCAWSARDYGKIDACLVAADVTDAQHTQLAANVDVAAAPNNLDLAVGDNLDRVRNILEAMRIPANTITTQHTFRQVLRYVAGLFMFAQTYHALFDEPLVEQAAELDLRWTDVGVNRRQKLTAAAQEHRFYVPKANADWTIRKILKHMADQWGNTPVHFGPVKL